MTFQQFFLHYGMTSPSKILVKTFILGANHGQYMQALGLKVQIKRFDPRIAIYHSLFNNHVVKELLIHIVSFSLIKYLRFLLVWCRNFSFDISHWTVPAKFDIAIIGSDMVWSMTGSIFKLSDFYFSGYPAKKVFAYAPSCGHVNELLPSNLRFCLSTFNRVSVRDYQARDAVALCPAPPIVCDPALFYFESLPSCSFSPSSLIDILIYGLPSLADFLPHLIFPRDYVVNSCRSPFYSKTFSLLSVFDNLIDQFQHPLYVFKEYELSSFILTGTFHGVIFALITGRPFLCVADDSVIARLEPYIQFFGSDRLIKADSFSKGRFFSIADSILSPGYDYSSLSRFVDFSREWLRDAIYNPYSP